MSPGLRCFLGVAGVALFSCGCILVKVPIEAVKTTGTIIKATGQVASAVGRGVGTTVKPAEKCASVGGDIVEGAIQAKAVKVVITAVGVP